ncbi:MAG: M24 family metallopeptidase, partial [Rhodospirillales bacterium]|nr:M24 family metallopeptidase [Rhodospirillales bacterium]
FMDRRKLLPSLDLGAGVSVQAPESFGPALDRLAKRRVRVDPGAMPAWVLDRLSAAHAVLDRGADPCMLPKACKNAVELEGLRRAHRRDGAALCRFLAWLSRQSGLSECAAADALEGFRRQGDFFTGLSFPTISGAGPNGAIVHYHSTPRTDRIIEPGQIFLLDSGAQYLDGTTDVTRTLAIGTPPEEARQRFTLVLKGHIALALARFPAGTTGSQLDVLARRPLWQAGLDYDHGTGHGVGSYLGVHEGPQRISKAPSTVALKPGMVLSNEPGYYKAGAYGIRIENLVAVTSLSPPPGAEREMLGFETLTLVPIDRALVEPALLTAEERDWLDTYHRQVFERVSPTLDTKVTDWLKAATQPVGV